MMMKLALLLPGYLDSPDYLHMIIFEKRLKQIGYAVERVDPCGLWSTGDTENYNVTNYLKTIKDVIDKYKNENLEEVVLIGHSLGGFTSIVAGNRFKEVTKVISLCSPFSFGLSESKWTEDGFRHSKRDLPNNSSEFRVFSIPVSFIPNRRQYSTEDELKNLHKPLMVFMALEDQTVLREESEKLVKAANNPYVVRMENMGHNPRHSEEDSNKVADEIEKFLGENFEAN